MARLERHGIGLEVIAYLWLACCSYLHMAKSFATSTDDSLSADSYLNILYMPSFTKSDRSRRSSEDSADSFAMNASLLNGEELTRSNLDGVRYEECVYYLQEVSRLFIKI